MTAVVDLTITIKGLPISAAASFAQLFGTSSVAAETPAPPVAAETPAPPVAAETPAPPVAAETPAPPVAAETPAPPVAAETPVPPVPPVAERDKNGIPWDERIHGKPAKLTASGRWRRRRNILDATYNAVLAEITPVPVPVAPTEQPPIPAVAAAEPPTPDEMFRQIMTRAGELKMDIGPLTELVKRHGVRSVGLLASSPGALRSVYAELCK